MNLPYDNTDENGHKIREQPEHSGIKDIDMTVMFERPGKRVTGSLDILVYEGLAGRPDVKNAAIPSGIEAARQARHHIERARERGLSPAEAIGVTGGDDSPHRQTFGDALDERADAVQETAEWIDDADGEDEDDEDSSETDDETNDETLRADDVFGGGA